TVPENASEMSAGIEAEPAVFGGDEMLVESRLFVALVRVEKTGFHKHFITAENRRLRLYPGAHFTGVFGNRYASDAYEGAILGLDNLHMLTAAGMIGTVMSKHSTMDEPTEVSLVGFLSAAEGTRLNLKQRLFQPARTRRLPRNLI